MTPAQTHCQPQPDSQGSPAASTETPTTNFTVVHKNARSLQSDDSVDELLTELQPSHWDVIAINETWRTSKRELWETKETKHTFAGSSYEHATRGVAFLIHHC